MVNLSPPEKVIEGYLVRKVIERGGVAYKFVSPAHRGVADRLVLLPNGVVWFVEVKAARGVLSPLQLHFAQRMKELQQNYAVVYNKDEVDKWLARL